ncbi:ankyrin repeat and MYND domain-containing protein 1 isoform X3 [Vulpes lagopus]|uniref:ankyrin repeat and MYND domain-containing protein 1 isoform X3 n=1 Tax=Vulpes lagopus TaxID=494514 RepID=UPI001BC9E5D8|nr:ankyrin repeat and MYND domain-containing protein 1 isoform X3 [Vulpes lagopus]
MENGNSPGCYYEIPNVGISQNQPVASGCTPAASEDLRILESSRTMEMFFSKRDVPDAREEEEEESEGPPRGQDLKEAYIQLVRGMQEWPDGCVYRGDFGLGTKLGHGEFSWPTGEGLYKADQRFGPGVETYPDGSQDVGLWFREHLIKLCTEVAGGFSIHSYPEYSAFLTRSPASISLSDEERVEQEPHEGEDPFYYDYKRFLLDDDLTLPPEMYVYSTDNSHLPVTCSFRKELDARVFLNDIPPFVEDGEPWFIKNETPLMVRIQKQAYKYRNKRAHSSWGMGAVLEGDRSGFARCGPKERFAEDMILRARDGSYDWIYGILRDGLASADVADAKGYTVLAAAALHCHKDIVNLLLDNGADVNKFTDEGLTVLSMCFLLYYPSRSFKPNIAERTAPKPQEAPSVPVSPSRSSSLPEAAKEPSLEEWVPTPGSQERRSVVSGSEEDGLSVGTQPSRESPDPGGNPQKWEPVSPRGSVSDLEKGMVGVAGSPDRCTPGSQETDFESDVCVHNYAIELSQDLLEKSAQAHSTLQRRSLGATGSVKGTMRRMALAMIERRSRWQTIKLLLRRGADPNLCCMPMHVLFLAVKAGDVAGVRLLLENGARTDIRLPAELGALTPLHIAAALPGEEGVQVTELLLHAVTDVDARAADQDDVYQPGKLDLLPSSLKLSNEAGPASIYHSQRASAPDEGGRTALHVACEREDSYKCARDVVRLLLSHKANPNMLWSGHSPLSLSIASGNDLIVKELLSHGADPNLLLTKGLGSALCVACDLTYEHQRSTDSKLALIDQLINYGADILRPVTLTQGDKVAVGTAVDYGYFKFYQDRKIAHCPFHMLTPAEREVFVARKRLLEYMGFQLRRAVFAKESQWDPKVLNLSKRAELTPYQRMKRKSISMSKALHLEEQELVPFFKFCYQCGRSIGVRLAPCTRCYGILTCSKYCKTKAWGDFHKRDCGTLSAIGNTNSAPFTQNFQKPSRLGAEKAGQKPKPRKPSSRWRSFTYNHE